ncbi:hypothetical protein GNF82_12115 [Clostridium perfringens]
MAYGKLNLSPEQFWNMGLIDFLDLANAQYRAEEEFWDRELERTAWQTAILANAAGTSKKQIKPEQLYKSPFREAEKTSVSKKAKDKEYVTSEQEKLKAIFGM